jgi:hypothetical protein
MWHSHNDGFDALVHGTVNESLHAGDKGFAALKAKALLIRVFAGNEIFEQLRPHKAVEDHPFLVDGVVPRSWNFYPFSDPITLVSKRDVNILDTNVPAYRHELGSR